MLTIEVMCHPEFHLVEAFRAGILAGDFKSFELRKAASRARARAEIAHKSPRTPGKVRLEQSGYVCTAKVTAPAGKEWDILHKFVGRLVHRFDQDLLTIRIEFPAPKRRRRR
jgi:hypothetical protein